MFNPYLAELNACGKYTTVGAALTTTFVRGATLARTGVGVVTCTLDKLVDAAECTLDIISMTTGVWPFALDTSDTVKTFTVIDNANMAAEGACSFNVWRVSGGAGR